MREVNAFDYWENHASAIRGMGGGARSPDPRYVFHTRYHEIRAGRAQFILRLGGVRAGFGELSVRLHAWKPDIDSNVSLVSGARLIFDGEEDAEINLPVRFLSQPRVLYALYGYLSEDSDVSAEVLRIEIEESEDDGKSIPTPPRSLLALNQAPAETRPANALLHEGRIQLATPVSQSCTPSQVGELSLTPSGAAARAARATGGNAIARWSEAVCLNVLSAYGVTDSGLEGMVVGSLSVDGAQQLDRFASIAMVELGPAPSQLSDAFVDFLLMPSGFMPLTDPPAGAEDRWTSLADWLARLKIGGLAAISLRYRPDTDLISSSAVSDPRIITRNEIGQWVLRLISSGHSVAPMAFAPALDLIVDGDGLAAFCLVVQRL